MEKLRRAWSTISASMSRLTVSQRLLVGSVAVVMVMTLLLIQLYAGKQEFVELMPGSTAEQQTAAMRHLRGAGIAFKEENGQIVVPVGVQRLALAQLAEGNALPDDSRVLFDNLIDKQSWTLSQKQNAQLETIAVQNELGEIIGKMSGVRSARVILNLPERRGLGQPSGEPSGAATVFPTRPLDQDTVDTIAHLVASSRGIPHKNVRVIDGSTNRQYRARDESSMAASSYLEYVTAIETRKQGQLYDMLSAYIKGVIVTVHAQVDVTRRHTESKSIKPENKGSVSFLTQEQSTQRENRAARDGGEPGPRSNTSESIALGGGAGGATDKETQSTSQYRPEVGSEVTITDDPRGHPTKINAVVNIPRPYFVEIWRSQKSAGKPANPPAGGAPQAAAEPTDDELKAIVDAETARIKKEVELQIDTSAGAETVRGEAQVSMIPTTPETFPGAGGPVEKASVLGVPLGTLAADGVLKTVVLGGVALVAMVMVGLMAARATKREALPSAAELVGIPPALENNADLVGEAVEADSVLQGLELTDDEMKQRKMVEQVTEMVRERPTDAAKLLGRWIAGT